MAMARLMPVCVLLVAQVAWAEYIEITLPEEGATYRPCAPSEIRWESDIDPGEGEVIEFSYVLWQGPMSSLGVSSNDGTHAWPNPPCWGEHSVIPLRYHFKAEYLTDPSVSDEVTFWLFQYLAEHPFALFIDFSGAATTYDEVQSRLDPPLYTSFSAYVGVLVLLDGEYGYGWWAFKELSFAIDCHFTDAYVPPSFENLLPGDLSLGTWDEGITLMSSECVGDYGDVVYVGRLDFFWLGGQADILVIDHPQYPRRIIDCGDQIHEFEVASHGGVWKDSVSTPVGATSWGSIKAMYRDN